MIKLTDLSNNKYMLNCDLILKIDSVPETRITLVSGEKYLVKESVDQVVEEIIQFRRHIHPHF